MHPCRQHDDFLTLCVSDCQKRHIQAIESLSEHLIAHFLFDLIDHAVKPFESIRETICELNACPFITLKEIRKPQLVRVLFSFVDKRICVAYLGASSSPLGMLTNLSVANLHAFTVKTRTLRESFYDECSLSFCSFHDEIEPTRHSIGVCLSFQLDLIGILSCESDCEYVAAFKIAAKGNRTNGYNLADTALNLLDTFIDLLPIEILQLSLCVSFYQLKPILLTIAHFAILST